MVALDQELQEGDGVMDHLKLKRPIFLAMRCYITEALPVSLEPLTL